MDDKTTISELRKLTKDFCDERDWAQFHTPKDMAMNAIIELSELLDHFRFRTDQRIEVQLKNPVDKQKVMAEFSDAFYSLLRLADILDFDISTQLRKKLKEIENKYPVEKSKGSYKKYDEL